MSQIIAHWLVFIDQDECSKTQETLGIFPYDIEDEKVILNSIKDQEDYQELIEYKQKHSSEVFTLVVDQEGLSKLNP